MPPGPHGPNAIPPRGVGDRADGAVHEDLDATQPVAGTRLPHASGHGTFGLGRHGRHDGHDHHARDESGPEEEGGDHGTVKR